MAHIFKHPYVRDKGIVIFTHKEWGYFTGNKITRRLKRERRIPSLIYREIRSPFNEKLKRIGKKYFIGVHFGFFYPHLFSSTFADFVFSKKSNLPNIDNSIVRIPLNSRDFTSTVFGRQDVHKYYDVMTVARDVKFKNYPLLFESIKLCLALRPNSTFLLIVPSQAGVSFGVEKKLAEIYYATFTRKEQTQITFLYLHPKLQWGLHQNQLADFYNRSRVFTLFSKAEGESRVISEALCCGLPIVTYSKLLGGGTDLLSDKNSVSFDSFNQAHLAWIKALECFPNGILEHPEKLTREDFTIQLLHNYFENIYQQNQQSYDGELLNTDHLDRRLPGHYYDVPWMTSHRKPTADVLSKKQFKIFFRDLQL